MGLIYLLSILRIELKALGMLCKCPITELHTQASRPMHHEALFNIYHKSSPNFPLDLVGFEFVHCTCAMCKLIEATHNSRTEHIMFGEARVAVLEAGGDHYIQSQAAEGNRCWY